MKLTDRLTKFASEVATVRESLRVGSRGDIDTNPGQGEREIRSSKAREGAVCQLADMIADVYEGKRPEWHLREAMSTSDFPLLFGDLLNRQMLGNYKPWPVTYPGYFKIIELADLRKFYQIMVEGGSGRLDQVHEYGPYPETKFTESERSVSVAKYGRRYGISFEMILQDNLQAWQDRPLIMATGARRSEEYLATQQMFDVNGPHASFFTAGNSNIITGNPALSLAGFRTAFTQIRVNAKDSDGEPVLNTLYHLIITPEDEITANELLGANEIRIGTGSGTDPQILTSNWLKGKVQVHINPYINYIATSNPGSGNPWLLIADPGDPTGRPAFMFAFLRGRRNPTLYMKDSMQLTLGGSDVNPLEGSFDNDSIDYKLRHFFGAAQGEPKMAVSSNGSGSA